MNIQMLKEYFQEFIDGKQHKIMFLNRKKDMFEEFKVIDAINLLEEKEQETERLHSIIKEVREYAIVIIDSKYWGNDGYINGKNEESEKIGKELLEILNKEDK